MDTRKYEKNGKYAAMIDFKICPYYLFENINETYAVVAKAYRTETICRDSFQWACNYIETGLKLWRFNRAADLVRTDFCLSAIAFSEDLNATPNEELDKRLIELIKLKCADTPSTAGN